MRKVILVITALYFSLSAVLGQVRQNIDQDELNAFKEKLKTERLLREKRVQEYLREHPTLQRVSANEHGDAIYLKDVIDGRPIFVETYNEGAAITTNTLPLSTAGEFGVTLTGKGMTVGVWDGGYNLNTHQEYAGRTRIGDGNEYGVSDHATHVMGTIIASGVVKRARGMAPEATGISFGFGNDLEEMTAVATTATGFMILSNHSYGVRAGWNDEGTQWLGDPEVSETEDWRFGYYDNDAANTDQLMRLAPYYLSVWSAGNQRGQGGNGPYPANGPYDILVGDKNAKNTLIVGAINKIPNGYSTVNDAVMSSFSCWGPTDDGRIKPDIVGAGVGIYSSTNSANDSYGNKQGTSMSAPNVTGSIMLIQQLYGKLTGGNFARSATLKALAFHTANDGGTLGPDYAYGWGILNAKGMADLLMERNNVDKVVQEFVLLDGETFELEFEPAANTEVRATIVWTDLPGSPGPANTVDGDKLMLINDLDMRINDGGTEYQPWILNPATPGAAAQKGDNFRDNSEQVVFTSSTDNKHTLSISHKESLETGRQAYSLVLTYTPKIDKKTYYWIGDQGGDWSNVSNWSLVSGGEPVNAVPSSNDNVIFDDNSFANDSNPLVTLTGDVSVASLKWLAPEEGVLALSDFSLSLTSSLVFDNPNISFGAGEIHLLGTEGLGNELVLDGLDFSEVDITVNAPSTVWKVTGASQVNSIYAVAGSLDLTLSDLQINNLLKEGTEEVSVDVSGASLSITSSVDFSEGNITWLDNETQYTIPEGANVLWNSGEVSFNGAISVLGSVALSGAVNEWSNVSIENGGEVDLSNNASFFDLNLAPGSSLSFQPGVDLTVLNNLTATGTASDAISITGDASSVSQVVMDGHKKVCLDFLSISNVNISGTASVTAGENSTSNVNSWPLVACENLLYSDFQFAYTCLSSLTMFTDLSTGAVTSWSWDFGDGNSSSEQSPNHEYASTGAYTVTLEVSDGVDVKQYTQELIVGETDLVNNTIVNNNGVLASVQQAVGYQWYKDGEAILGATQRTLNTEEQSGTYFVLTFSDGCNLKSNEIEIVVTGIEDEENELLARATTISPNPAEETVKVSMVNDMLGAVNIKFLTLNGAERINLFDKKLDKEYIREINVKSLASGVYIIRIVVNNRIVNKKLLIR
ncbi:S8 family serine peptidase [Roseivirga pacifica]|uniref:S8 family serine peptidase n=1 Tax=Roseivirga pacifica TaxID=1267423 RepID=UPI00227BC54A|nr:S8 family serine peptidase [Roseivirga pacifica]